MVAESVDRVITARVKRVAAAEPFTAQPNAADDAIPGHGVHHVLRTGRPETASRGQPGRDGCLIKSQQADDDYARHRSISLSNCRIKSGRGASAAARRGFKTISRHASNSRRWRRNCSRIRRRIRLRITAFPTARGMVNPTRGPVVRRTSGLDPGADGCRNRKATK